LRIVNQIATRHATGHPEEIATVGLPIPPFASGKAATALDWADPEEQTK
jgi:hypothetical protein